MLKGSQKAKYNNCIIKFLVKLLIIITLTSMSAGCGRQEIEKLRAENQALKSEVASLKQEIAKLKETPDYHYQQGVDFLSSQKYEEAKSEFETVIDKYPTSPLVTSAKQQLIVVKKGLAKIEAQRIAEEKLVEADRRAEERRRQEEEKYRPRSPEEAIQEWIQFRNNEDKYKGTVTTWRFPVKYLSYENPIGYLDTASGGYGSDYAVVVHGPEGFTYQAGAMFGKVPSVKEKDWIIVTGKFCYVSSDNVVVLSPIRVKNEGYK
ncbi:Outer membrane protein assembly factor BamD [subsurface metagenome]